MVQPLIERPKFHLIPAGKISMRTSRDSHEVIGPNPCKKFTYKLLTILSPLDLDEFTYGIRGFRPERGINLSTFALCGQVPWWHNPQNVHTSPHMQLSFRI